MSNSSTRGQLLTIEGVRGRDLTSAARRLSRSQRTQDGAFSIWDASGIFYEIQGLDSRHKPSQATLILLYAADLHFRLRWQILPALEEGKTVVAAPYVETAIAAGLASGLPRKWVTELFRFAPKPSASFWLEGSPVISGSPESGFLEFCGKTLHKDFFDKFSAHFAALRRRGKYELLDLK